MACDKRIAALLTLEAADPLRMVYLSFATDEEFYGAVIIEAHGIGHATMLTHQLGINPGGQVMAVDIPAEMIPSAKYHNRLLTKEEILEFWPDSKTIREHEAGAPI
jgi:hypothetical protein